MHIGFRLPPRLIKRIDAELEHVKRETGFTVSRSQLYVALIEQALDARAKTRGDK